MVRTAPQLVALAMSFAVATASGDAVPGKVTGGGTMINGVVDTDNAYPNVGAAIVIAREGNPLGVPAGTILGAVTGTLIHNQTFLTAGHFTVRAVEVGGVPPFVRLVVTFLPDALDPAGWIDISHEPGTQVAHPSFPRPCYPPGLGPCPAEEAFGHFAEAFPDTSDVGLIFLSEPVKGIAHGKLGNKSLSDPNIVGTRMLQVGYGVTEAPTDPRNPYPIWDGLRRYGTATLGAVPGYGINEQWANFNRDPAGTCHIDSGSPTFLDNRLVAVASDGGPTCDTVDYRARVDSHHVREWIRSTIEARFGAGAAAASLGR
jgi:hypothetical protein